MGKRKRYLNKYNRMRSWTTPNRGVLSEYAGRIRSLAMDKPVPVTIGTSRGPVVERILELFQADRQQGVEHFHYIKHPHPAYPNLMLFFSGNTYRWGYYGRDEQGGYVRLTLKFEGKPAAMRAYGNLQHYWIERIYINAD